MNNQTTLFSSFQNALSIENPQIKKYFLMGSPITVAAILALYALFVLNIGPRLMTVRKPLKLEGLIIAYNWLQIFANGYLFVLGLSLLPNTSMICSPAIDVTQPLTPYGERFIFVLYWYTMLKVVDLADTVFFVLRKKNNQVTFLHVYHHIMMICCTWSNLKFYPGGHPLFVLLANMFVHVVMYFYYFVTAWRSELKTNVWWKKYITQLQIVQHCFIVISHLVPLVNPYCSYSKLWLVVIISQALLMVYLFGDFYLKVYVRKEKEGQ